MRIIVTGWTSLIGSHIVDALVAHDHRVTVVLTGTRTNQPPARPHVSPTVELAGGLARTLDWARRAPNE